MTQEPPPPTPWLASVGDDAVKTRLALRQPVDDHGTTIFFIFFLAVTTAGGRLRACRIRIEIPESKIEVLSILTKVRRCARTESKSENRKSRRKATDSTTYSGRSQLCTHASNLALGNTDPPQKQANAKGNSIPGLRLASHGGGGASDVDAPKKKLEIISENEIPTLLSGALS